MNPIAVEITESDLKDGVVANPSANMCPRFITLDGRVLYAGVHFQLEGSPGFYPSVKLADGSLSLKAVVGFHY